MDFGLDQVSRSTGLTVDLQPEFEEKVLEEHGDHVIFQQADGVRVLKRKFMSSIPQPQSHLLTDRESWRKHFKPRLDPTTPSRFPSDWAARVAAWKDPNRDEVIALRGGSLYGKLRNWMGVENLSYVLYDDPAWFEEMVSTVADCIIGVLERVLASGVQFDGCGMWEDMAYRGGPLLSPSHFKKYLSPHYRRITDLLHNYNVDVVWLDCDGKIDDLIPLWLEAGVNCMFPVEIGVWGADPLKFRQEYGRDLLMMGGFDKHILQSSEAEIEAEVYRLLPLIEEGGYIGFCDHRVPPDVSLKNYLFYLETVRRVWGKGLNLRPILVKAYEV
jgi:uroporphyrinogen decarboxylase